MLNIKQFDGRLSNDECENDQNVNLSDVRHSNMECENDKNVERQSILTSTFECHMLHFFTFDIRISKVK